MFHYDLETGTENFISVDSYDQIDFTPTPASFELRDECNDVDMQHVIGNDTRTLVSNPTSQYQSTCLLGSRFNDSDNGVEVGTGWLINKNYVMTEGHMLYTAEDGYAKHTAVYIGASGGSYKQYRLGHSYHVGADYVENCGATYYGIGMYDDWGIVELESPVTVSMSYLGRYGVNSASDMQNGRIYYTQGYPGDLNSSITSWNKWNMYKNSGTIQSDRTRILDLVQTQMDMNHGQSGSPVYSYRTNYGYCAEGIVVAMSDSDDGEKRNFILLINDWLMSYINTNLT